MEQFHYPLRSSSPYWQAFNDEVLPAMRLSMSTPIALTHFLLAYSALEMLWEFLNVVSKEDYTLFLSKVKVAR